MKENKAITKRSENYSEWYLDIVEQAELAENSAVRGCMVIRPYGYSIWENFQKVLDKMFKDLGHVNAYFPIFIPKSFMTREAKHVEGFAPECAIVTHYRLKKDETTGEMVVDETAKLEEELIVRPTSETIIYDTYSKWIKSYRDLPLLVNQWANVVRWEMRTRPFLRTAEFLWQEGHTAHATLEEADDHAKKMLNVYADFAENYLAIPVIKGMKSESEKFAGGLYTYAIEAMMQDGKALQAGTSHNLGDNFAKAFDIRFLDKDGLSKYVWQTSWGLSTRMLGALIMMHSDDKGLVVPPKIAPLHVVIIPIYKNDDDKKMVNEYIESFKNQLEDYVIKVDNRDYLTLGERHYEWEKKGVPIRIEVGPRDVQNDNVVVIRRDTFEKCIQGTRDLKEKVRPLMSEIQINLYDKAKKLLEERTFRVDTYDELVDVIENKAGFALAHWDGTSETEALLKEKLKITIRCIPFDSQPEEGKCILTGKPSNKRVIFAKAY